MSAAKFIKIEKKDNVATALHDSKKGDVTTCDGVEVTLLEDILQGHKVALEDIKKESFIYKYGYIIGVASTNIKKGERVHVHNLEGYRGRGDVDSKVHDSEGVLK